MFLLFSFVQNLPHHAGISSHTVRPNQTYCQNTVFALTGLSISPFHVWTACLPQVEGVVNPMRWCATVALADAIGDRQPFSVLESKMDIFTKKVFASASVNDPVALTSLEHFGNPWAPPLKATCSKLHIV